MRAALTGLVLALTAAAAVAEPAPPADRSLDSARIAAAEAAVCYELTDPDSARFRWADHYVRLSKFPGQDWICGQVNSRNPRGGYSGFVWFNVGFDGDQVAELAFDDPRDGVTLQQDHCRAWGY